MPRTSRRSFAITILIAGGLAGCQAPPLADAHWQPLDTGTTANFRGLHVVDSQTVWASGSHGTLLRSTNGGRSFEIRKVFDEPEGELRDIHAFDADHAIFIACQPARIYRTRDGGESFTRLYAAHSEKAFLNALAFFDDFCGLAFGDAEGDRFQLLRTTNGGRTWAQVPAAGLPPALLGEGGFAASGTCLTVNPDGQAWITTGISAARIFHSRDFGQTWRVFDSPLEFGPSAGGFSVAFGHNGVGVVVGGDYRDTTKTNKIAATSPDHGQNWSLASSPPAGFRSCVQVVPGRDETWVAVGETGSDYSADNGQSWLPLTGPGYHVHGFAADGTGYAAGAGGRFARLTF